MNQSLYRLEFHRILEIVQDNAGSLAGKKLVSSLLPATDRNSARIFKEETL